MLAYRAWLLVQDRVEEEAEERKRNGSREDNFEQPYVPSTTGNFTQLGITEASDRSQPSKYPMFCLEWHVLEEDA
eukprot:3044142-Amphidinium_carterae.1